MMMMMMGNFTLDNDDSLVFRSYSGFVVFVWVYGSSLGGYNYTLKMSIYHVVRARELL